MQEALTFGVLGPMFVRSATTEVVVGEPRRRSVLAALLLDAGQTVPFGRLADLVWGDHPPTSARKAIQVYVSQLRSLLADLPDVSLTTQRDGYCLICPLDMVDLHRFRSLTAQAQSEQAPAPRRERLREAIALWRGPAFADNCADGAWLHVSSALEEERLAALEDLYEADLRLGESTAVLPRLRTLVAEHPLRERMTGLLMTALHRSGRSTDATEVYRALRQRLVAETGMEPGRVLTALHRTILAGEPAMPPPQPPPPSTGDSSKRDLLDTIGRLSANNLPALLEIGDRHLAAGDYDRALACYHSARALARDNAADDEVKRASLGIDRAHEQELDRIYRV